MAAKKKKHSFEGLIADNRKARYNYEILDTLECGIELKGSEIKSLRSGQSNIAESYASAKTGEVMLYNAYIPEYLQANRFNHETRRPRKLLAHRREISKLASAVERDGMTLVPLRMYFNQRGRAKILLGIARGKKVHDKRETEKNRDWNREKARLLRDRG